MDGVPAIIATLEQAPRSIDQACEPAVAGGVPDAPGFYVWWAVAEALPGAEGKPHPLDRRFRAFYVGISPSRAGTRQQLRGRVIGNHVRGNTAASTFRFALASLLREERNYRPCVRGSARGTRKYVLPPDQNSD